MCFPWIHEPRCWWTLSRYCKVASRLPGAERRWAEVGVLLLRHMWHLWAPSSTRTKNTANLAAILYPFDGLYSCFCEWNWFGLLLVLFQLELFPRCWCCFENVFRYWNRVDSRSGDCHYLGFLIDQFLVITMIDGVLSLPSICSAKFLYSSGRLPMTYSILSSWSIGFSSRASWSNG